MAITDTWLTDNNKHLDELTGYQSYHITRKTRRQDGVTIFVSDAIHSQEVNDLSVTNENIEINTFRIKTNPLNFLLCAIYRPNSKHIGVDEFKA